MSIKTIFLEVKHTAYFISRYNLKLTLSFYFEHSLKYQKYPNLNHLKYFTKKIAKLLGTKNGIKSSCKQILYIILMISFCLLNNMFNIDFCIPKKDGLS